MTTQATAIGEHTGGECLIPTGSRCSATGFLRATIAPVGEDVLQLPFTYTWERVSGPVLNGQNTIQVVANARTVYTQTSLSGLAENDGVNTIISRYNLTVRDSSNPPIEISTTVSPAQYIFRGIFTPEESTNTIAPNVNVIGNITQQTDTAITTSTNATLIGDWLVSSYESAETKIIASSGGDRHVISLLITHDGTTAYTTTVDSVLSGSSLFTTSVTLNNGKVEISVTSASSTETTYTIIQTLTSPVLASVTGTHTGGTCSVDVGESCTASGTLNATITPATGITLQAPYTYTWTRIEGAQVNSKDSISVESNNTTEQITTEISGTATLLGSNEVTSRYAVEVVDSSTPPVRVSFSIPTATYDFVGT